LAQDLYQELGVVRGAGAEDIRKSFRKLAKELHPDRNPGDKKSEERFKRISAAFDILGDPEKKAKYDRGEIDAEGHETMRGFNGGGDGFQGFRRGGGGFEANFEGVDLDEILGGVFGARGRGGRGFSMRGSDVRARLEIDLEDAIKGTSKRIAFADGRELNVTIPKGAAEGQVLRLAGQGYPGRGEGQAGDALIELVVRPHPVFRREDADLHMDLPISVPDAVLGAKVKAPTPDGPVTLTVQRHANSGQILRLKGRGAVDGHGRRGDLFAHLVVTLPDTPDPELERFAEAWRRERPYSPR
jgi:DnaJ-class molecular chaperone